MQEADNTLGHKRDTRIKDLTGQQFGFLTALELVTNPKRKGAHKGAHWVFSCVCGNTCIKTASNVQQAASKGLKPSCGCKTNKSVNPHKKHGMYHHPAYRVWRGMITRCTNPRQKAWMHYGGRGITVCPEWKADFSNFWNDMGATYQPGLQLDRTDNDLGYNPNNCRWVTQPENARNKRNTIKLPGNKRIADISAETGIPKYLLYDRHRSGRPLIK